MDVGEALDGSGDERVAGAIRGLETEMGGGSGEDCATGSGIDRVEGAKCRRRLVNQATSYRLKLSSHP